MLKTFKDEGYIDWTVEYNISEKLMGAVAWGENMIDIWWLGWRTWRAVYEDKFSTGLFD